MDAKILYEEGKALLFQDKKAEACDKFQLAAQMGSEEAATSLRIIFGEFDLTCTDASPRVDGVYASRDGRKDRETLSAEGDALFANGEYKEAFDKYKSAAKAGSVWGIFGTGFCYGYGKGVARDDKTAVKYFLKAAKLGNSLAQYELGQCYIAGEGVEQDNERAIYWYQKAAEQGNVTAQRNLGDYYYFGIGVEQNNENAAYWWKKAADMGDNDAHLNYLMLTWQ